MYTKGMLIIISGPSGSGKGTVTKQLGSNPDFAISISVTTRAQTEKEIEGKDYFFRTKEQFEVMKQENLLLEHAEFVGEWYGTPVTYVKEQIEKGKNVVLEIDVNGALQVQERFDGDCTLIFLMPPSMKELRSRLINRKRDTMEKITDRLRRAMDEIKVVNEYDYLVINDTVEKAVENIYTIVEAEKLRPNFCSDKIKMFLGDDSQC